MSDTTGPLGTFPLHYAPGVDLVALVKECRMGLSVMLDKVGGTCEYDPSDQARELIGRVDRIVDDLAMTRAVPSEAERYRSALEVIVTGDETSTVAGAVAIAQQALELERPPTPSTPVKPPLDTSETEVGMARFETDRADIIYSKLQECLVVVSGPDKDGDLCVLDGGETYLPPETAKALAVAILKRLQITPMELEY